MSRKASKSVQKEILEMFLTLDEEARRWTFEVLAKLMREEEANEITE